MEVHLGVGVEKGGRVRSNGYPHLGKAEYGYTVYCNETDYGPVRGGVEEAGGTGRDAVVGIGGT